MPNLLKEIRLFIKNCLTVFASFLIMLCLGGVYGWSIIVPELMKNYGFSAAQSQLIMGLLIGILPIVMIFAGKIEKEYGTAFLGFVSAIIFTAGYLISGYSKGSYYLVLLGNGVFAGIATAFGYLAALTSPVKCFPERKGLMTGIAVSGFGLAATVLSFLVDFFLKAGVDILQILKMIGIVYGMTIFASSFFLRGEKQFEEEKKELQLKDFIYSSKLYLLILGFFLGTFAGLLVVGSLKPIGMGQNLPGKTLVLAVSVFAIANFLGRIVWGFISDFLGASLTIFIALSSQAVSIFILGFLSSSETTFLLLSILIGFSFGGNFVLFAKETADIFGVGNLGLVYPYVSLGYALGGLLGPFTGGLLFDIFGNYLYAIYAASLISFLGGTIFFINFMRKKYMPKGIPLFLLYLNFWCIFTLIF